jgi:hypothetical protein
MREREKERERMSVVYVYVSECLNVHFRLYVCNCESIQLFIQQDRARFFEM